MGAALTIAILLALSVSIVRIAAVAMRLTGLPENIARFQSVSALTGTGFTTHEAEMIVNYPVRRRMVVTLMVLGNLGLVSVAATFIVAFVNTGSDLHNIAVQAAVIVVAIGITFFVTSNKTLDRRMCDLIGVLLMRYTALGAMGYHRILQLGEDVSVAEHDYAGPEPAPLGAVDLHGQTLLAIRPACSRALKPVTAEVMLEPGDTLVLSGPEAAHEAVAESLHSTAAGKA